MSDEALETVRAHLADIVDGSASAKVTELVASRDDARDLVYEAERVIDVAIDAAADYHSDVSELEALVLADAPSSVSASSPAASTDAAEASGREEPVSEGSDSRPVEAGGPAVEDTDTSVPERAPDADAPEGASDADASERAPDASGPSGAPPSPEQARRRRVGLIALAALVVGLLVVALWSRQRARVASGDGWAGRLAEVSSAYGGGDGVQRCSPDGAICSRVESGSEIPAGSLIVTDGQTRALVSLDGARLIVDRRTRVHLDTGHPRALTVEAGAAVVDVDEGSSPPVRIDVAGGSVETSSAKVAIDVAEQRSRVDVVRGVVAVTDAAGRTGRAVAGESVDLRAEGLLTSASGALGDRVAWSEQTFRVERDEEEAAQVGLGELVAKKPGSRDELPGAVTLASHDVSVRISGGMARTEITEVFKNHTGDVLEGILRFPLPPGAQIERLALETDGKLEEGAFVDRDRAAAIWRGAIANAAPKAPKPKEEIVWVPGPWRDPALLEWQRGGRFELRIFPIPKHGSRRVVLAYTERVPRAGERRRYRLPLPYDPGKSAKLERFSAEIVVRGHDPSLGVRPLGYDMDVRDEGGATRANTSRNDFSPAGDLVLEYGLVERERELTAWAYAPGPDETATGGASADGVSPDAPFAVIALRPKLPRWTDGRPRSYAVVVDSSRSMIGERWARARRLATTIVRELGRGDPVTVLACDVTCREAPGHGAGSDRAQQVAAFLEGIVPEGGSDVAAGVEQGLTRAATESGAVRVVYIGDGTATVGPTQPAFLEHDVRGALDARGGTVTVVPVGGDADVAALEAVAAAGRGVVVAHVPGRAVLDTAYAVLGATYGHALSDVRVSLPEGLVDVAPVRLATLPAGGEAFVVARMTRPTVQGTVKLSGSVGGEPFEQSYPLELAATTGKGNAFVPRLFAATQIAQLERDGSKAARDRAVALSARYSVASRFTSLLVLESPAMFRAFGLDNQRRVATWTGDDDDESADSDGEIVYDAADDALGKGRLGTAYASAPSPSPAAAPRRKSAPKPKAKRPSALDPWDGPSSAAPAAEASGASDRGAAKEEARGVLDFEEMPPPPARPMPLPRPRRRTMVPMRKVWERSGTVDASSVTPSDVDAEEIADATRAAEGDLHRDALSKLYRLYFRAGRLDDAARVAERWSTKDPLDAGALTARADVAAARGDRDLAIRILGSVVDVRPGDHKAQWRLARLHRWAGNPKLGCRHSLAVSQIRPNDAKLLVEAVRCSRDTGQMALADRLLTATDEATRTQTESLSKAPPPDAGALRGDLKLEATWDGGLDVDLALIHPDGHRVSWLGAPTRSVISARDVLSPRREGLALHGAKPGQYVIEVTRAGPSGPEVRGTVEVTVGKTKKTLPFSLSGTVLRLGVAKVFMKSRLVPLNRPVAIPRAF